MPIVEPKIAKTLEAAIIKEMKAAYPSGPDDQADSHKKLAGALAKAIAKILADTLLKDAQIAAGIPTAGSPSAQVTVAPGKII